MPRAGAWRWWPGASDELRRFVLAQSYTEHDAQVYAADVRDGASITAAGRSCIERQGLPDAVIANAGISVGIDSALFEDLEVLHDTLQTNVFGIAATFQPFIGPMRQRRRGTLVGMASVAGIRGLPGHAAYCASKAAAIAYCESLRGECRPFGVSVVTLVPGYIDTPLTRGNPYPMPFLMPAAAFAEPRSPPSRRAAAIASFRGRWRWWPSCCACCPMACSTACSPGGRASRATPKGCAEALAANNANGRPQAPVKAENSSLSSLGRRRHRAGRGRVPYGLRPPPPPPPPP